MQNIFSPWRNQFWHENTRNHMNTAGIRPKC
uniref:Uncharacterized protein n=1 Tax=Anguilla anguilla TaxID=7936 RepID=A0A0E9VC73_ANGAN